MLGTLRMDIDTCINEYIDMAPDIFPVEGSISGSNFGKLVKAIRGRQRFDPVPLEEAVKRLVKRHLANRATRGEDTPLRFEASRDRKSPQCKMYEVCSFHLQHQADDNSRFVCATSEKVGTHVR